MTLVIVAWLAILGLVGSLVLAAAMSIEREPKKASRRRWRRRRAAPNQIRVMSESKADGSLV
jgi:hypothetical protein